MKPLFISLLALSLTGSTLTGCASVSTMQATRDISSSIVIDTKDINTPQLVAKYQQDMEECAQYAARIDVQGSTGNAALVGGLFGAILGGMAGNRNTAGIVGLLAAAESAGEAHKASSGEAKRIMTNCMLGRGYSVLN